MCLGWGRGVKEEEAAVLCAFQWRTWLVWIWGMDGLCYDVLLKTRMGVCSRYAASQVMHATLTKEGRYDREECPRGDLEVVDLGVVCLLAVQDDDVAVPGGRGWKGVPAVLVVVRGDELAESGERLEAAAWFAASLEDEGGDGDVDAVGEVGGVVGGEGSRVEDDGAFWRGETVGEDGGRPCEGGGGALGGGGGACGGRELWECGEGANGAETEVVLDAGAELCEVGECTCEIVGLGAVGDGGVGGGREGGDVVVVVVRVHGAWGGYLARRGGRARN